MRRLHAIQVGVLAAMSVTFAAWRLYGDVL